MKKKKIVFFIGILWTIVLLLGACKKNDFEITKNDEIDRIEVTIANENSTNKKKRIIITDARNQERILTKLNAIIGNEQLDDDIDDTNNTSSNNRYTIVMCKNNKIIQEYTISEETLTEGSDLKKRYDVPKRDKNKLNNLKNHLDKLANKRIREEVH